MGTLTGKQIDQTYDGLIKTNDEQPISGTLKTLQDGVGNDLPVQVSTTGVTFTGTVTGDNNTTYQIDATGDGNNIVLEFLASDLTQQDITLIPGTDITFSLLNPNEITINSTGAGTDTTYTLGVDESVPDGLITLQASDGSPIQEVVFQCDGNITMDTAVASNTLDVFVAPYDLTSSQDGADVDINLNSTYGGSNVTLEAGTNITLTNTGNNILIDAAGGGGTDTTYDFAASQVGANSKLALTGSDATIDAVTLVAGNNVTLTTVGSDVTIDAAGGGGTSKSIVISTGVVNAWVGPAGQDVLVMSTLIPANTVTGAATIEFRSPVVDGPEGQFNYSSFQITPTVGNFSDINLLGRQGTGGGPDSYFWYRSITVGANGTAYYIDQNNYAFPTSSGDPVIEMPMNWAIDQYFTIHVWCDAANATWKAYSPSLTITNA